MNKPFLFYRDQVALPIWLLASPFYFSTRKGPLQILTIAGLNAFNVNIPAACSSSLLLQQSNRPKYKCIDTGRRGLLINNCHSINYNCHSIYYNCHSIKANTGASRKCKQGAFSSLVSFSVVDARMLICIT